MKLPTSMLRRLEWRLGLRPAGPKVPEGMTREAFEEALADLPSDVEAEELREFVEARGEPASPIFQERLRSLLWAWIGHAPDPAAARRGRRHLN